MTEEKKKSPLMDALSNSIVLSPTRFSPIPSIAEEQRRAMKHKLSWTQPVCITDWSLLYPDGRTPVRVKDPDIEQCALCGQATQSGIYFRADPMMVPFPALKSDD